MFMVWQEVRHEDAARIGDFIAAKQ